MFPKKCIKREWNYPKYIPFTSELHYLLFSCGYTHIKCYNEIPPKDIKHADKHRKCLWVSPHAYIDANGKPIPDIENIMWASADTWEDLKITSEVEYPIRHEMLAEMYSPKQEARFYLMLNMENDYHRKTYQMIPPRIHQQVKNSMLVKRIQNDLPILTAKFDEKAKEIINK